MLPGWRGRLRAASISVSAWLRKTSTARLSTDGFTRHGTDLRRVWQMKKRYCRRLHVHVLNSYYKLFKWLFSRLPPPTVGVPGSIPGRDMSVLGPPDKDGDDLGHVSSLLVPISPIIFTCLQIKNQESQSNPYVLKKGSPGFAGSILQITAQTFEKVLK
jgi:hypothetical protein